jgi:hypothetical protein
MIKEYLQSPRHRTFAIALVVMLSIIAFVELNSSSQEAKLESIDTFIPFGFVLVPIELQNADSLSAMISEFGVVDLFSGIGSQQKRVGRNLKLMRAPLNPDRLAVLVPENEVSRLMQIPGPYWAVMQNPNLKSASAIQKNVKKFSKIEYFDRGEK